MLELDKNQFSPHIAQNDSKLDLHKIRYFAYI